MKHKHSNAMVLQKRRNRAGRTMERGIPLVLEFLNYRPSLVNIIKRKWKITYNDFRLMTLFPNAPTPIYMYRNRIKLGSILSKKRYSYNFTPSSPELFPDQTRDFEFLRFNHPKPLPLANKSKCNH